MCREGEAADNLYVIQSGVFEAFKSSADGERVLFKYEGAGAFGELALMYNCPRAATVRVSTCRYCRLQRARPDGYSYVVERRRDLKRVEVKAQKSFTVFLDCQVFAILRKTILVHNDTWY